MVRDFQCHRPRNPEEMWPPKAPARFANRLHRRRLQCHGLFHPFSDDQAVEIYGVEAAGHGVTTDKHAASIAAAAPVCCMATARIVDGCDGQIAEAHSISAGLDYPGIGPRACLAQRSGPREVFCRRPTTRRGRVSCAADSKASSRRWSRRMRWRAFMDLAPQKPKDHLMVVNFRPRRQGSASVQRFSKEEG